MVLGIERFKEWFRGYENHYAIIGGTACDLLMTEEGLDFRGTKDIDLVLIVEAINPELEDGFGSLSTAQAMSTATRALVSLSSIGFLIQPKLDIPS